MRLSTMLFNCNSKDVLGMVVQTIQSLIHGFYLCAFKKYLLALTLILMTLIRQFITFWMIHIVVWKVEEASYMIPIIIRTHLNSEILFLVCLLAL